jgi:hypothetical protein
MFLIQTYKDLTTLLIVLIIKNRHINHYIWISYIIFLNRIIMICKYKRRIKWLRYEGWSWVITIIIFHFFIILNKVLLIIWLIVKDYTLLIIACNRLKWLFHWWLFTLLTPFLFFSSVTFKFLTNHFFIF